MFKTGYKTCFQLKNIVIKTDNDKLHYNWKLKTLEIIFRFETMIFEKSVLGVSPSVKDVT